MRRKKKENKLYTMTDHTEQNPLYCEPPLYCDELNDGRYVFSQNGSKWTVPIGQWGGSTWGEIPTTGIPSDDEHIFYKGKKLEHKEFTHDEFKEFIKCIQDAREVLSSEKDYQKLTGNYLVHFFSTMRGPYWIVRFNYGNEDYNKKLWKTLDRIPAYQKIWEELVEEKKKENKKIEEQLKKKKLELKEAQKILNPKNKLDWLRKQEWLEDHNGGKEEAWAC